MAGIVGIQSYAAVAGTTAATSAIQATMGGVTMATTAVANAILPPGSEGASMLATLSNKTNTNDFNAKFGVGLVEMQKRNAVVATHSAENAAADMAGVASLGAVNPVL
ncbi:hypothetical protein [Corynebacterium sp. AOP12-C2-36]|uniref:hypothetical protein n=1 Tax=Corynebacterium sp. AOP12-C2-36 TaxID=3457723 RepID=UPI0040338E81